MIPADAFLGPAREAGFNFYSGVPCSFLTPIIDRVIGNPALAYVAAASEGEAVAIAAGSWLAGRRTVVMCQNSGLGNAVNPLTSLNHPFRIPTLLIVTWRGAPGLGDEPQHELMGAITTALLDVMRIAHRPFPATERDVDAALAEAVAEMERDGLPFAFVMEKGTVRDEGLVTTDPPERPPGSFADLRSPGASPGRAAALERFLTVVPAAACVIAATGYCGRELFTLADRAQNLYQVGSMGCAAAMALGVALHTQRPVVAIDGDGAALMKLGTMATVGHCGPGNLIHLILDNGAYESTGGQPTTSANVDFAAVASACGYAHTFACDDLDGFERALRCAFARVGPHLIHMRIARGVMANLGRPSVKPADVARRFKDFVRAGA